MPQPQYFSPEEAERLRELGVIASWHILNNPKRVANALGEILDILKKRLGNLNPEVKNLKTVTKEAAVLSGWEIDYLIDELLIACSMTGQLERGLDVCDSLVKSNLKSEDELAINKAELLAKSGEIVEAEKILANVLARDPQNIWRYIHLGDIYNLWQIQEEARDLARAEDWYYKAYDLGLADAKDIAGRVLLRRLSEICIERLKQNSQKKLLDLLQKLDFGGWQTLVQLKEEVYSDSFNSELYHYLQAKISGVSDSLDEANRYLNVLSMAYNFMPQIDLDDLCPFEMVEYFPPTDDAARIRNEMYELFEKESQNFPTRLDSDQIGASWSEHFSIFQHEFMKQIDTVTGLPRHKVGEKEIAKAKKSFKDGKFIWMGFTKYRNQKTPFITNPWSGNSNPNFTRLGRNDPCHCGSGKKYKKCCLGQA